MTYGVGMPNHSPCVRWMISCLHVSHSLVHANTICKPRTTESCTQLGYVQFCPNFITSIISCSKSTLNQVLTSLRRVDDNLQTGTDGQLTKNFVKLFQLIFNFLIFILIACSVFREKLPCWLSCLIWTRVLDFKNTQNFWVLNVTDSQLIHTRYVTTVYNYSTRKFS